MDALPLIHIAVRTNDTLFVKSVLTEASANVNATDQYGRTALDIAVSLENFAICELLIDHGIDVNLTGEGDSAWTPLDVAILRKNKPIQYLLMRKGAIANKMMHYRFNLDRPTGIKLIEDVLTPDFSAPFTAETANIKDANGNPLICLAASYGRFDLCRKLIDMGADLNVLNNAGFTPLQEAILMAGCFITARMLFYAGADANIPLPWGEKLIDRLRSQDAERMADLLAGVFQTEYTDQERRKMWEMGLEPEERVFSTKIETTEYNVSDHLRTPEEVALYQEACRELADKEAMLAKERMNDDSILLRKMKGYVELKEGSLVHFAVRRNDSELLEILLQRGENIDIVDFFGHRPIFYAVHSGNVAIAKKLLDAGALIYENDKISGALKQSMLHVAVEAGHTEMTKMLLETKFVSPNIRIRLSNYTPLHMAAKKGQLEIVELLLAAGANPDFATDLGEMPLHSAMVPRNSKVVNALIEAGADVNAVFPAHGGLPDRSVLEMARLWADDDTILMLKFDGAKER